MTLNNFNRTDFLHLMGYVSQRSIGIQEKGPGIIMRHDVDDDLDRSVAMAEIESDHGVIATYFILNTAPYWSEKMWPSLQYIRALGHEIAWHNNVITEWLKGGKTEYIDYYILKVLGQFNEHGFKIKGSASHGDSWCYIYNYVNNQVFKQFIKSGLNNKPNTLEYEQVDMHDYGLEYEAYAISRDVYLSESGRKWRSEINEIDLEDKSNRIMVLIHPQHWQL